MDPALKQRLLGAAVLIALAVVFVPMFFPGTPPESESSSVSLDIPPEPGTSMKSQTFALDQATGASAPVPGASVRQAATLPAAPATATGSPDVAAQPVTATPATPASARLPAPTNKTEAPIGTAAAPRFAVSVGVYARADNADSRLAQAKLLGYPAYMEDVKVDGKPAHGVRVGPFDSRASAEAARLRLASKLPRDKPALVALDGTRHEDAPASAVPADKAGGWAVQLAAYRTRADAIKLRDQVRKAGFEGFVDDTRGSDGTWWRVRVGPRTRRADAEALKNAIKRKLGRDGLVVSHP